MEAVGRGRCQAGTDEEKAKIPAVPQHPIPLTQPTLDEEEERAVLRVLRSRWVTQGPEIRAFEEQFACAIGTSHAIAVANGTLALEIAYAASGLGPGDEVLLPAITFVACWNAVLRAGAVPVLADVQGPGDLTLSPASVESLITERTRLVITMPHGGFPPDMQAFEELSRRRGVTIIEDACHAPLAELNGRRIGSFGLAGTWSFYGNKNMTTGEGGMITTNDAAFAEKCRLLRSHGLTSGTWQRETGEGPALYDVLQTGTNARMDELRAAIGLVQLEKLPSATAARRRNAEHLRELLAPLGDRGLEIPYVHHRGTSAHHLFCVLLPPDAEREAVMSRLREEGIQTSVHYRPIYEFSAARGIHDEEEMRRRLPVTAKVAPRLLTLPLGPRQTAEDNERIAEALGRALG